MAVTKQLLHTTVLDIKIYYYPRNAIFPEAEANYNYFHLVIS